MTRQQDTRNAKPDPGARAAGFPESRSTAPEEGVRPRTDVRSRETHQGNSTEGGPVSTGARRPELLHREPVDTSRAGPEQTPVAEFSGTASPSNPETTDSARNGLRWVMRAPLSRRRPECCPGSYPRSSRAFRDCGSLWNSGPAIRLPGLRYAV
ncbi:hypothetical protein [Halopolyspora algeriensis]|nr:hypothetical protein [Halopolyspora algeriensis]